MHDTSCFSNSKIFFKEEGTNERTDRQMESVPPPMNDCNLGDAKALSFLEDLKFRSIHIAAMLIERAVSQRWRFSLRFKTVLETRIFPV